MTTDLGEEDGLSGRQQQMVQLAAEGITDKEMAARFGVSPGTLRTYWDRLRLRYGAQSRTEVVARVLERRCDHIRKERDELLRILKGEPYKWAGSVYALENPSSPRSPDRKET